MDMGVRQPKQRVSHAVLSVSITELSELQLVISERQQWLRFHKIGLELENAQKDD